MDDAQILAAIMRSVTAVVPEVDPAAVDPGQTLAELGCNSIDRADIVTLAMEELGITVPVWEFQQGRDIRALVELMGRYA